MKGVERLKGLILFWEERRDRAALAVFDEPEARAAWRLEHLQGVKAVMLRGKRLEML